MTKPFLAALLLLIGSPALASEAMRTALEATYTLYRSSATVGGAGTRIHVATFDAKDGATYNRDNCEIAKSLFQKQPGVTVTYWCERGYYNAK
jgi:hypothetical protein